MGRSNVNVKITNKRELIIIIVWQRYPRVLSHDQFKVVLLCIVDEPTFIYKCSKICLGNNKPF